ncbi:MAG: tripartite tricarboxylate transporter substrate binding protein [Chloroflexota bacterium]
MFDKKVVLFALFALIVIVAACAPAPTATPVPKPTDAPKPAATAVPPTAAAAKPTEAPKPTTAPTAATGLVPATKGGYPSKALEIVAPAGAGGGWDTLARTVQRALETEKLYPQPTTVVNKVGGGGGVGLAYIFTKKADDYELVVYSPPLIINTLNKTFENNYKELTPLAKLITDYQVILVKADSPYKTMADLMAALKKDPGAVKFAGASSPGSMDHLAIAKLAKVAGIDPGKMSYVAFNDVGSGLTALLGGNVGFMSTGVGEAIPQIEAKTVRALGVSSAERRGGVMKDVPTWKESGWNVTYEVWRGIFGAPGMSADAKAWWGETLKRMSATKTWKDSLEKLQWVDAYADSDSFAKFLAEEEVSYKDLMTSTGFIK